MQVREYALTCLAPAYQITRPDYLEVEVGGTGRFAFATWNRRPDGVWCLAGLENVYSCAWLYRRSQHRDGSPSPQLQFCTAMLEEECAVCSRHLPSIWFS